jgi:hypothetical protein
MCFQVYFYPSLRLKGKWSIRQRQGFPSNSDGIIYPLPLLLQLSIGMTLHSYLFYHLGENIRRALKFSILAINVKGGESIKPKAKGPHQHFKIFTNVYFNWVLS